MYLDEFEKITISGFEGLYDRGNNDDVPQNHAIVYQNLSGGRKKQTSTRMGTKLSTNVGHAVVRIFYTAFTIGGVVQQHVLTCDGLGHIYEDNGVLLLTVANMVDFVAVNIFNRCYILPVGTGASFLYVWDGVATPRQAAGNAPTASFTVTVGAAASGHIDIGTKQFAVAFVTSSGFTTQPGPKIATVFTPVPGVFPDSSRNVVLTGIPVGPTGTTQRVILVTKSGLNLYFYAPGGTINDNVTTTVTLNFFDTDLAVSADSLFNLKESIASSTSGYGGAGLLIYRGRLIILDETLGNFVQVSDSGNVENFSTVTGFINVGAQSVSAFEYYGVIYLWAVVGLYSTSDNGGAPSSWPVNQIDLTNGMAYHSLTKVREQAGVGPLSGVVLGINREGLYAFNGVLRRPALSLKIQDVWDRFTHGAEQTPTLVVDFSRDILYCLLPLDGSTTPNTLVVGDFSNGLTVEDIQWSTFTFPWTPTAIAIEAFPDGDDFDYWLRIGNGTHVDKLSSVATDDSGVAITTIWQSPLVVAFEGAINEFRHLRFRAFGTGNMQIQLLDEDNLNAANPLQIALSATPGKDLDRQINYQAEKMTVKLTVAGGAITLIRMDVFAKPVYPVRPG